MTTHLITLVIKQPSDAQARQLMYQELLGLISRYGGEVTSTASRTNRPSVSCWSRCCPIMR
ncbi:dTDP-D-glucose 4,6-dehydratase [Pseudomonas aeruginosa]|nr:dTDP-D-glucose 4,6-dehydratase [Pseudomonas aeruginosa]